MSFLNPFFLIGSVALAIPVLIHLVLREKSEIVPFSSLMFLLKVPKRSIRQQKIKNLLLMALRLLILALLVGAFARPYLTQPAKPSADPDRNRSIILMLDNSYSMRYGTNFERLKAEAVSRIDAMRAGDRMALLAFNDSAMPLGIPTSDKNVLKAAVAALEPSYAGTRYYEAFTLADRIFSQVGGGQRQLVLISDFQRNGWNRSSRESVIGTDVKTETVNLSVANPTNAGIDSAIVDPKTSFTRTYTGRVIARIHNHRKDDAVTVPVSVSLGDKEMARKTVNVAANSTAVVEFTGFDLPLGFSKGRVRIEAQDPLMLDNEFLFALERREKLKVLVVDSGKAKQSFFLRQAYTSSADLPFEVNIMQAASVTPEEIARHEVVVVNDVARLSDKVRERLDEMRKTGQGQLMILGENSAPAIFTINTYTNYTSSDYNGFRPNPGAPYSFAWNSPPWATAADYSPLMRGRGAGPAPAPSSLETRQYKTLEEYSRDAHQDEHSILVDYDVFMNVPRLDAQDVATVQKVYKAESFDFRLKPGSTAVDRGKTLPNVTDGFGGAAPDLGAIEVGQTPPHYGPRD